jgi:hypothetical protein
MIQFFKKIIRVILLMVIKVLKRSQIDYKPGFTSTKTKQIFSSGIEDIEDIE